MDGTFSDNQDVDGFVTDVLTLVRSFAQKQADHIQDLNEIGAALSAEHDLDKLLEMILGQARRITNSDGGTLYLKTCDEQQLKFTVVENQSLDIRMGGTRGEITWPALNLYKSDGSRNNEMVAVLCALTGNVIRIDDVYAAKKFNFEGTKKFDSGTGFRSKSMLVIPMKNHEKDVIGICQLLNRQDNTTGEVIPFNDEDEKSALSLASQAAVAITNAQLINDLRILLESYIESIASAIDAKSPYTGGHVRKVSDLTMMIANAVNKAHDGFYGEIFFSFDQLNELRIAALMHDVGKITTPEYVVDKATKLQTIYDRIGLIRTRFEVLKRDLEIDHLKKLMEDSSAGDPDSKEALETRYSQQIEKLADDLSFLETVNLGSEYMSDEKIQRIKIIAKRQWREKGVLKPLLTENEINNFTIRKGTLTNEERQKINDHARMSLEILSKLPFPKKLKKVPEIAGGHHEKLNGKGYPQGLTGKELALESRIIALADIFEALTASDRPYKKAKKMSEVIKIINFMVKDGELDKELVEFFFEQHLHEKYGQSELKPEQLH